MHNLLLRLPYFFWDASHRGPRESTRRCGAGPASFAITSATSMSGFVLTAFPVVCVIKLAIAHGRRALENAARASAIVNLFCKRL